MSTNTPQPNGRAVINSDSHLSDVERSFLATASYPVTDVTPVSGNTGSWSIVGKPRELGNGLEIYALKQQDSNEVVFAVRGSDSEPDGNSDWGLNGANVAFSGTCHPQVEAALRYVEEFVHNVDNKNSEFTYSTTGHSKGGGISQIIAHTFGLQGTALDPAPGGAVIQSPGYTTLMEELGIAPLGFLSMVLPTM